MNWLVWKEYRLNRLILIVGATLLVAPHAVALVLAWYGAGPPRAPSVGEGVSVSRLAVNLLASGFFSLVASQLALALLGGNAIACERADRSVEFLAYLPVSRARILVGKITLALMAVALIWAANLLIMLSALAGLPELPRAEGSETFWGLLGNVATIGFVLFSVAWLMSSVLESPAIAALIGLISPWLVGMGVLALAWVLECPEETAKAWYLGTCLVLAAACFAAGTWYYLRRVEP